MLALEADISYTGMGGRESIEERNICFSGTSHWTERLGHVFITHNLVGVAFEAVNCIPGSFS